MSTQHFDYDLAVIGGGSGGYAAARTGADAKLKTVVIEGGDPIGGLCILRGCMPTKALLYAAEVAHLARQASTWGIHTGKVQFDFPAIMQRKHLLIEDFASFRRQQLQKGAFQFIHARAKFVDPHTVQLNNGQTLAARSFILATGSVVSPPPLPQLSHAGYITSDEALTLTKLPRSIIILGGGAVAVEFAQFFARLDVKVTLIQRSPHILKETDEEAANVVENVFKREGITLHTGTTLTNARRVEDLKEIEFQQNGTSKRVQAQEILLALGRSPNTSCLNLDHAGVATEGDRITTNTAMQTSASHIYAAGDCTGPHEIVHIAIQQGEIAAHNIAHAAHPKQIDYRLLISVVFTEPQLATVGLTEKVAIARNIPYLTASYPFDDHGKSLIMEARDGFVKLLANPVSGEILGGCCVGPVAGELIHEIVAAMHKRMTVHELATMPHYHPTLAEIWTYPAEELAGQVPPQSTSLQS